MNKLSYCRVTPNGAGKTTTMNILAGLTSFDSGRVVVNGYRVTGWRNNGVEIGYLPEVPVFYEYMTAREYLIFLGQLAGNGQKEGRGVSTDQLLEMVNLSGAAERKIGGYSRGMIQRLALAVALFNQPRLLFLDEPTSALDPEGRREMIELIRQLKESQITVFLSTHILDDVERVCDRVAILDEGRIILIDELKRLQERFIQPVYDLELDAGSEVLISRLEDLDWVNRVKSAGEGKFLSVYVNNMEIASQKLIKELADSGQRVIGLQVRKSRLEDIYIGMVNQDENI